MSAYYNEIDPHAAQWLRGLISAGHIAPGEVDERSIEDVTPNELREYTQCHFFAGIGGWSHALRIAGWPDDEPCITGSCPCQPFSSAGKGAGFDDERHLWPAFFHIIRELRRAGIPSAGRAMGEQVASGDGLKWLDLVCDDLEGEGYTVRAADSCSAGFGAPHIRQRMYWMADANGARLEGRHGVPERTGECAAGSVRLAGGLADGASARLEGAAGQSLQGRRSRYAGISSLGGMADTDLQCQRPAPDAAGPRDSGGTRGIDRTSPLNGFWRNADWLGCRDGKWRPVAPGSFPLAFGLPASMGRCGAELSRMAELAGLDAGSLKAAKRSRHTQLVGYGNAINPQQAAAFIQSTRDAP